MAYKPISSMLGFFAANAVPHKHAHRTANVQNNAAIFFLIILPPVSAQVSCSFIVIKLYHLKNRLSIPETCYSCKFQDISRRDKQKQPEKAHWPFLAANKKSNSILSGILQFPAAGGLEVSKDKAIQITIHHGIDITGLVVGTVILDHGVGHEHIAADLVAPGDLILHALDVVDLVHVLLLCDLIQLCLQHFHGVVTVLELAALGLAADHDAGGLVDQTNSGRGLVDVLAACTGGAEHLHLDVLGADVHLNGVVQFGHHFQRGKAGLAAGVGIKRRHADQTVHAVLAFQQAVGVGTLDHHGSALHAGLIAILIIQHLHGHAVCLCPLVVHTVEHLGPVLRLGAAGTGGTEAQDWAEMLYRMYNKWAQAHGMTVEVLDYQDGDEAGMKSASMMVKGANAYGLLKSENGVHRLVRVSPFDANARRQTSFASLEVMPELDNTIQVDIRPEDIEMQVFRSSGAGGQHINKTSSAVRLIHKPTGVVVSCQTQRSQFQNRDYAMEMLKAKLYQIAKQQHMDKIDDIKGVQNEIAWGHQIRSYVFMPYTMVKDHRTNYETGNVDAVMDGDLDGFIFAYLKAASRGELQDT